MDAPIDGLDAVIQKRFKDRWLVAWFGCWGFEQVGTVAAGKHYNAGMPPTCSVQPCLGGDKKVPV